MIDWRQPARRRLVVHGRDAALIATLLALIAACPLQPAVGQETLPSSAELSDFPAILQQAGITAAELSLFDSFDGKLTSEQSDLAERIRFRLQRFGRSAALKSALPLTMEGGASHGGAVGQLVVGSGAVESVAKVEFSAGRAVADEADTEMNDQSEDWFACPFQQHDGPRTCVLLCDDVPDDWNEGAIAAPYNGVAFVGVVLSSSNSSGDPRLLIMTERIEWRPADHPEPGVAWLAQHGLDVSLLDSVQHGRRFAKPSESSESEAFYGCLDIMRNVRTDDLARLVRGSIEQQLPQIEEEARREEQRVRELQADGGAEASLALAIAEQASKGLTSVAPMFLQPEDVTGQFVLIEGIARRAVRVVGRPDRVPGEDYYELEVFTPDSQNLPIVCCVTELPDGFPEGDVIRAPVRLAGVFFKKWAYQTRGSSDPEGQPSMTGATPLIIAPSVTVLGGVAEPSRRLAMWLGLALTAGLAVLWAVFWRIDRNDHRAGRLRTAESVNLRDLHQ